MRLRPGSLTHEGLVDCDGVRQSDAAWVPPHLGTYNSARRQRRAVLLEYAGWRKALPAEMPYTGWQQGMVFLVRPKWAQEMLKTVSPS